MPSLLGLKTRWRQFAMAAFLLEHGVLGSGVHDSQAREPEQSMPVRLGTGVSPLALLPKGRVGHVERLPSVASGDRNLPVPMFNMLTVPSGENGIDPLLNTDAGLGGQFEMIESDRRMLMPLSFTLPGGGIDIRSLAPSRFAVPLPPQETLSKAQE